MSSTQDLSSGPAKRSRLSLFSSPQAGLAAAAAFGITLTATGRAGAAPAVTDVDIFNFALNFEYLGAEYYLRGVTGKGLYETNNSLTGGAANGGGTTQTTGRAVTAPAGSTMVPFSDVSLAYFGQQLAVDELAHVTFIREVLGAQAVAEPAIDLTAFTTLAAALNVPNFNPYANEVNFLIGAYILEDTCVTALTGAAALVSDKVNLQYAAGLLGVESQQAGAIRGFLAQFGQNEITGNISKLRAALSGVGDQGTGDENNPFNISNGDLEAQAFRRTPAQILAIAYGNKGVTSGSIFPEGVSYSNSALLSS